MKKQSCKKLVEILAVELKEWPEGVSFVVQDKDGKVKFEKAVTPKMGSSDEVWMRTNPCGDFTCDKVSRDWHSSIVTRAQWEAERAKLSNQKANAQGWIRHRGGKMPVSACKLVEIRTRGGEFEVCRASGFDWAAEGKDQIMAYRLHEPEQAAAPEVTAQNDGPLQWRDRITEIDREVESLEEERASLIQKLADEGLQLLRDFAIKALESAGQPDMSDWRNWREGDMVEIIDDGGCANPVGSVFAIYRKDNSEMPFFVNGIWYRPEMLKFHSRPTK